MRGKYVTLRDVFIIGFINAAIVGALDWTLGDPRRLVVSNMWWCFFGAMNVYLAAAPSVTRFWR